MVTSVSVFSCLVSSYTKFIQEGKSPCIHEAAKEMIESENQNVLLNAVEVYKKEMQRLIGSTMPDPNIIVNFHEKCMKTATDFLRGNIVYDDIELFLDTAKVCDLFSTIILDSSGCIFTRICILKTKTYSKYPPSIFCQSENDCMT